MQRKAQRHTKQVLTQLPSKVFSYSPRKFAKSDNPVRLLQTTTVFPVYCSIFCGFWQLISRTRTVNAFFVFHQRFLQLKKSISLLRLQQQKGCKRLRFSFLLSRFCPSKCCQHVFAKLAEQKFSMRIAAQTLWAQKKSIGITDGFLFVLLDTIYQVWKERLALQR